MYGRTKDLASKFLITDDTGRPSSRTPGNHGYGNGLAATFVPGRWNVCEGYHQWAANESYKESLASLFHCFLNVESTSQIFRACLTGI